MRNPHNTTSIPKMRRRRISLRTEGQISRYWQRLQDLVDHPCVLFHHYAKITVGKDLHLTCSRRIGLYWNLPFKRLLLPKLYHPDIRRNLNVYSATTVIIKLWVRICTLHEQVFVGYFALRPSKRLLLPKLYHSHYRIVQMSIPPPQFHSYLDDSCSSLFCNIGIHSIIIPIIIDARNNISN